MVRDKEMKALIRAIGRHIKPIIADYWRTYSPSGEATLDGALNRTEEVLRRYKPHLYGEDALVRLGYYSIARTYGRYYWNTIAGQRVTDPDNDFDTQDGIILVEIETNKEGKRSHKYPGGKPHRQSVLTSSVGETGNYEEHRRKGTRGRAENDNKTTASVEAVLNLAGGDREAIIGDLLNGTTGTPGGGSSRNKRRRARQADLLHGTGTKGHI